MAEYGNSFLKVFYLSIFREGKGGRKRSPSALLVGMQVGAAIVESSVEIPEKIENGSLF